MNTVAEQISHQTANEQLPWFVNGTLKGEERARVAQHVEECRACQADLQLCEEMAQSVRFGRPVPIAPLTTADELLSGVETTPPGAFRIDWRIAAVLAVIVVGAAALSISQRFATPNQVFTTVTEGASVATVEYVFEIRLAADLDAEARQMVLSDLGADSHVAEEGAATFHLTISLAPQSLKELEAIAADIARRPGVESADILALQVPVR